MADMNKIRKLLQNLNERDLRDLLGVDDETDVKALAAGLSEQELVALLKKRAGAAAKAAPAPAAEPRWFERSLCGLTKDGQAQLKELERQAKSPMGGHVDRKQLRYLRQLKKMKMAVPPIFREEEDPRALYNRLKAFCEEHDIPAEIVQRVVPALVSYLETGKMRPIIFVGEKGCGKTTAVKLLVQEALQLPTEVVKIPQLDGSHGMTGDSGSYRSADAGCLAKARLRSDSLLVAYIFDEIDKVVHPGNRSSADDELLSVTDESNDAIFDNYLETTLVGLEHCPMFFTANDLQQINPTLADRCTVIPFPSANAERIKSIASKYAEEQLHRNLYRMIDFDFNLMEKSIDHLVQRNITSLRKHQQMIETVLENALNAAFNSTGNAATPVTEDMFAEAEQAVLGAVKRSVGF